MALAPIEYIKNLSPPRKNPVSAPAWNESQKLNRLEISKNISFLKLFSQSQSCYVPIPLHPYMQNHYLSFVNTDWT